MNLSWHVRIYYVYWSSTRLVLSLVCMLTHRSFFFCLFRSIYEFKLACKNTFMQFFN